MPTLDHYDLKLVENGQYGTSNWRNDPDESAIIYKSRWRRKRKTIIRTGTIAILIITFIISIMASIMAEKRATKSTIYYLLNKAQIIVENQYDENGYADKALLLALHAEQLDRNKNYTSDIYQTISKIIALSGTSKHQTLGKFCQFKDRILVFYPNGEMLTWRSDGGHRPLKPSELQNHIPR